MNLDRKTPLPEPTASRKDYTNDVHCWRSFCEDLIYAGAYGSDAYLAQVLKRRQFLSDQQRSQTLEMGRMIQETLANDFPDETNRLRRAQRAWDNPEATLARYNRWLPKRPPTDGQLARAERERRAGVTEEQRQKNADEIAASL